MAEQGVSFQAATDYITDVVAEGIEQRLKTQMRHMDGVWSKYTKSATDTLFPKMET
jgi:hypothetical protein